MDTNDNKQASSEQSLFMNEEKSDIMFKIQDQTIPAHKQVLIEKSKYFKNLFNSGMIESRQEIIEINDCIYIAFQEFLRFLYLKEVKLDTDLAMELIPFADKYLQDDLMNKCLEFLRANRSIYNIFKILDFARARRIDVLKRSCMSFLEKKIKVEDVFELLQYLSKEHDPEFIEENRQLRDRAMNLVIWNFKDFCKRPKQNEKLLRFAQEFLIKNIDMNTIGKFSGFIGDYMKRSDFLASDLTPKDIREEILVNLKEAAFDFAYQNYEELRKSAICHGFNDIFWRNFVSYILEVSSPRPKENKIEEIQQPESQKEIVKKPKKKLKRGEPKNSDDNEEKPELKKTKKK